MSSFDNLPEDVIRHILCFSDVPSLASLSQTSKSFLSDIASDDQTWSNLVERRFKIETSKRKAKYQGGFTWKDAYRSLALCNRMPKTRFSRKVVFAKQCSNNGKGALKSASLENSLGLWVLLGHTENSKLRISNGERLIELQLVLQNVKSGFVTAEVDLTKISLQSLGDNRRSDQLTCRLVTTGSMKPNSLSDILRRSSSSSSLSCIKLSSAKKAKIVSNDILTLLPFECAVVSLHFRCSSEMIYETDFLSRALSVNVPVRNKSNLLKDDAFYTSSANFIPEKDVWRYYSELPGGCLTLTDRNTLVPV